MTYVKSDKSQVGHPYINLAPRPAYLLFPSPLFTQATGAGAGAGAVFVDIVHRPRIVMGERRDRSHENARTGRGDDGDAKVLSLKALRDRGGPSESGK